MTFADERDEDAGRTAANATQLDGIEEWTWSGPGGSCPDSLSEVAAERA